MVFAGDEGRRVACEVDDGTDDAQRNKTAPAVPVNLSRPNGATPGQVDSPVDWRVSSRFAQSSDRLWRSANVESSMWHAVAIAINPSDSFVSPRSEELRDVFGVEWYFLLSDQPSSFRVVAGSGERVGVWVTETPATITITVQVTNDDGMLFQSDKDGATRLSVSRDAPEIVCEFAHGGDIGRLEISLSPQLRIKENTSGAFRISGLPWSYDD